MNRSKPGLNEPFYKWLDDVRRAIRKEKELLEKLEYYNMKFVGYKGVNYERIGSSSSSGNGDEELLYWLEKIDIAEQLLSNLAIQIKNYSKLLSLLNDKHRHILSCMVENKTEFTTNRSRKYQIIGVISKVWDVEIREMK